MKIKKFNEKHLHHIENENNYLEDWFDNFLSQYFNESDIYHSEVVYNNEDSLSLIIDFDTNSLNSKLFLNISNFLNFFEDNGKYYIFANSTNGTEWLSIEAIFKKYPDDLDVLLKSKKFNL